MSRPTFLHPRTNERILVPQHIKCGEKVLTWKAPKAAGWSVGGWYEDETGKEFLAKFPSAENPTLVYAEKLLNYLVRISVGRDVAIQETAVGHGLDTICQPCFLVGKVPNYRDLIDLKAQGSEATEADHIKLRKEHSRKFHQFYSFCALIGNDDLNEENLGLHGDDASPLIIDLGIFPPVLFPESAQSACVPYHLASFIGHRNLNGMQLVRRRHFGHDDFLNPNDRLKPQLDRLKPEDISYLEVLDGVKNLVRNKHKIFQACHHNMLEVLNDAFLTDKQKELHIEKYSHFVKVLRQRIGWMEENFRDDLEVMNDAKERERFARIKWRLHPKFAELMEYEDKQVSQPLAQTDLANCFGKLSKTREEVLASVPSVTDRTTLQSWAKDNLVFHNAVITRDVELIRWMTENEIGDINQWRPTFRKHNYHLFRTTPLHATIATYHDALFYQKTEELEPLREIVEILRERFISKNGGGFDEARDYKAEGTDGFAVKMTFTALQKYDQIASEKALAATTIQRTFRAHKAHALAGERSDSSRS